MSTLDEDTMQRQIDSFFLNNQKNRFWEQGRLFSTRGAVIGSSTLSHFLLSYFACVGVGVDEFKGSKYNGVINLFDDQKYTGDKNEFLHSWQGTARGENSGMALETIIKRIDPYTTLALHDSINGTEGSPEYEAVLQSEVIIDTTNDPASKEKSLAVFEELCRKEPQKRRMYISASAGDLVGCLQTKVYGPPQTSEESIEEHLFEFGGAKDTPGREVPVQSDTFGLELLFEQKSRENPFGNLGFDMIASDAQESMDERASYEEKDRESLLMREYAGVKQGALPSATIATLICEEVRKFVMPLTKLPVVEKITEVNEEGIAEEFEVPKINPLTGEQEFQKTYDEMLQGRVNYSAFERLSFYFGDIAERDVQVLAQQREQGSNTKYLLKETSLMLAGLGGVGSWAGVVASLLGAQYLLGVDDDKVAGKNLNRQILQHGLERIGTYKADNAQERIRLLHPASDNTENIICQRDTISEHYLQNLEHAFDYVLSGLDDEFTVGMVDEYVTDTGTTFIRGVISPESAKITSYVPAISLALSERESLRTANSERAYLARDPDKDLKSRCLLGKGNVVMMNSMAGAMLIDQVVKYNLGVGNPNITWAYNSRQHDRYKFTETPVLKEMGFSELGVDLSTLPAGE